MSVEHGLLGPKKVSSILGRSRLSFVGTSRDTNEYEVIREEMRSRPKHNSRDPSR